MQVHRFESTGEAYNASQTRDATACEWLNEHCDEQLLPIENGDVLVVESEHVVGILWDAWPTAVSRLHGHFHTYEESSPECVVVHPALQTDFPESVAVALNLAARWENDDDLPVCPLCGSHEPQECTVGLGLVSGYQCDSCRGRYYRRWVYPEGKHTGGGMDLSRHWTSLEEAQERG